MSNAAQAIWDRASSDANRVALRGAREPWTYGRLCERAAAVASRLREAQVAPGDRVLLVAPSVPEFAGAYFGILAAGAIAVTANTMSTRPELEHLGSDAEVAVVMGWSDVRPMVTGTALRAGASLSLLARFDAEDLLDLIRRDKLTIVSGVPTMWNALLAPLWGRSGAVREPSPRSVGRRPAAGGDPARVRGALRVRDPRGLRAVRDDRRSHLQRPAASAEARLHGDRAATLPDRGARRRRRSCPHRRGGRGLRARAGGDEGILEPARRDRRGAGGRLAANRRPGHTRRGRGPAHRRPQEGSPDPGRVQRVSS